MSRRPEIGNVQLYPDRPLHANDKNGYVLKFYCPIRQTRVRRNAGTRDRREARQILRECRERLLNGQYVESGGAITLALAQATVRAKVQAVFAPEPGSRPWHECFDDYYRNRKLRTREKSLGDMASRIEIARRILDAKRESQGLPPDGPIADYATLSALEYLQERLLAGDHGLYSQRMPTSVNSMLNSVTAFLSYCQRHKWIESAPILEKLDVEEVMKGRPITGDEFTSMLAVVPEVVGVQPAASWKYVLEILWESAFRVGDVMNFSWDDVRSIHPQWPNKDGEYPTLAIPASQKNKKMQQIPLLPGLQALLEKTPRHNRHGWVVNPLPLDNQLRTNSDWFKPTTDDLRDLAQQYSNSAIARACGVTETSVRKWLRQSGIERDSKSLRVSADLPSQLIAKVRKRAECTLAISAPVSDQRLSTEHVGRVISEVGEAAGIVVRQPDQDTGRRIKYASAHDLRRGCAQRLINAGVSAETLRIVMRHDDFKTTERYYGAIREAQPAAAELHRLLVTKASANKKDELMGGLVGGTEPPPQLNPEEVRKLKALLNSL